MPLTVGAYVGALVPAFSISSLAVAGGVGGGALYMPIYIFLTEDAHIAVPLSKVTTNGVGWSAFFFSLLKQHPDGGPLIDYDVALLLEPVTLVGTIVGVILNAWMTTAEVLIILVVVLSITAWKTGVKGFEQKRKEDAEIELQNLENLQNGVPSAESATDTTNEDIAAFLAYESRQYPWEKLCAMASLWAVHAAIEMAVGGPKAVMCGGMVPKAAIGCNVAVQCTFTLWWRRRVLRRQARKEEMGIPSGSYRLDSNSTMAYPALSCFAGVCAGALGIAGGLIKGPLMVNWGLLPQAATTTAIFMIVFTSSSTILQFAILGRIELVSAAVFWLAGFGGGLLGSKVLSELMRSTGRQSYLTIFLALLIVLSGVSMSGVSLMQMAGFIRADNTGLAGLCSS